MIVLPDDPQVLAAAPHALQFNGSIALPHRPEETKLLRNLGYTVPAPIMYQYDWANDTPFKAQKVTAGMLTMNDRAFVLNDLGTGKTRSVLYALDFLMQQGWSKRALVVAPLSTLTPTWHRECFRIFPHINTAVLHGDRKRRRAQLARKDVDVYIVNHHGLKIILNDLQARSDIDTVVIDELATYRNQRTDLYRTMRKLIDRKATKRVWGLTGAPTPNSPTDAWAQVRLIAPNKVPVYFKQFQAMTMAQVSMFRWVPKREANNVVFAAMQPSVRYSREDCVDLPPLLPPMDIEVPLTSKQQHIYTTLFNKLRIDFQNGEGYTTAANEGVLLNKLLQVSLGHVYTTDKGAVHFPNSVRVEAIRNIIMANSRKTIVFVPFIHAVEYLAAELSKTLDIALVYGQTSKRERDRIFTAFQNSHKPQALIAHPGTMSHGLTLTAANTIVWNGPAPSLETYIQANARISRPSQTAKQLIIHLFSSPVEKRAFRRLARNQKTQGVLLKMFQDNT